jgi:hypothetical protein
MNTNVPISLRFSLFFVAPAIYSIMALAVVGQESFSIVSPDERYRTGYGEGSSGLFFSSSFSYRQFIAMNTAIPSNRLAIVNSISLRQDEYYHTPVNTITIGRLLVTLSPAAGTNAGNPTPVYDGSFWIGREWYPPAPQPFITFVSGFNYQYVSSMSGLWLDIHATNVSMTGIFYFDASSGGQLVIDLDGGLLPEPPCTPHKATAVAQVVNGFVVGANISDSGCGYTNTPIVMIKGGGGTGASATAVVTNGQVAAIHIVSAGCCYTNTPVIVIASPPFVPKVAISVSRVRVTQSVVLGRRYLLESSNDLITWNTTGPPFTAESETIDNEFEVDMTGHFFRLREVL